MKELLAAFHLDPESRALRGTASRAVKAWAELLLEGYTTDTEDVLGPLYPTRSTGAVLATRIPFLSMCPHHLLPLTGEAHVAFSPRGAVPGFGRLAKLVDAHAHRLVLQEDLTQSIADALLAQTKGRAAACLLEARHTCVAVTDPARLGATFRTSATAGDDAASAKLLAAIERSLARKPAK